MPYPRSVTRVNWSLAHFVSVVHLKWSYIFFAPVRRLSYEVKQVVLLWERSAFAV